MHVSHKEQNPRNLDFPPQHFHETYNGLHFLPLDAAKGVRRFCSSSWA
jgi:hypothetical protein